jgi:hypothetical protein
MMPFDDTLSGLTYGAVCFNIYFKQKCNALNLSAPMIDGARITLVLSMQKSVQHNADKFLQWESNRMARPSSLLITLRRPYCG